MYLVCSALLDCSCQFCCSDWQVCSSTHQHFEGRRVLYFPCTSLSVSLAHWLTLLTPLTLPILLTTPNLCSSPWAVSSRPLVGSLALTGHAAHSAHSAFSGPVTAKLVHHLIQGHPLGLGGQHALPSDIGQYMVNTWELTANT